MKFLINSSDIAPCTFLILIYFFSQETQDKLVPILSRVYKEFYGESAKQSPDMCRIINDRHYERLSALLDKTKGNKRINATTLYHMKILKRFQVMLYNIF